MGNCMESKKGKEKCNIMKIGDKEVKFVKDVENNSKGIRVKMVLTKEELQWLMLQLRNRSESGATRIEDVLVEIEKARKRVVTVDHGWKPSLDSITEIPEVLEMNR
ncbi:hypothetical protein RND81_13G058000 [Saponaria officinalis]|uniref:Uncharacterized protein n=1 Tax=Saponaria officinalis TaxID=3572 RepID=A0AAW1GYZ8_SAPOF